VPPVELEPAMSWSLMEICARAAASDAAASRSRRCSRGRRRQRREVGVDGEGGDVSVAVGFPSLPALPRDRIRVCRWGK